MYDDYLDGMPCAVAVLKGFWIPNGYMGMGLYTVEDKPCKPSKHFMGPYAACYDPNNNDDDWDF